MESLRSRIACSSCQQPLLKPPKVLPGCLHVFCRPCLEKLPIAFLTNPFHSKEKDSIKDGAASKPQLPEGGGEEWKELCCAEVDGWLAVYDDHIEAEQGVEADSTDSESVSSAHSDAKSAMLASLTSSELSCDSLNQRPRTTSRSSSIDFGPSKLSSSDNLTRETGRKSAPDCDMFLSKMSQLILTVTCPKCDRPSLLPAVGFDGLQTSYITANMASACETASELQGRVSDKTKCEKCREEAPAVSYCVTCRQFICEDHAKCHRMWRELASHKVLPLSALSSSSNSSTTPNPDTSLLKLFSPSLNLGNFKCQKHSTECKFFCTPCEDLACSYCTTSTHKDATEHHSCISITPEVISEARSKVVDAAEKLSCLLNDLDLLAGSVQTQCEAVVKKAAGTKDRIDAVFSEIADTLESRKLSLFDKVDALTSDPLKKLKEFSKRVESLREHILDSKNFVQDSLDHEGNLGLLPVSGVISAHSSTMKREYQQLLSRAEVEPPTIDFSEDRDKLYDYISSFGSVQNRTSKSTGQNMNILSPVDVHSRCNTVSSAKLSLYEHIHKLQTLTVSSSNPARQPPFEASTSDVFNPNLTDSLTGTYVYQPPVLPSPSDINPSCLSTELPSFAGMYVRSLEGLFSPSGIRLDDEFRLVVCEFGTDQVTTFDQSGNEISRVGQTGDKNGQFRFPQNVAFDREGKMIVVDSIYRLQMFDSSGQFLCSRGSKGKGRLQFLDPVSVAISPEKQVFVCERENHRIQVLNSDLSFNSYIGKPGRMECQFYLPGDIAISDDGHLYVADTGNHRIQVLTLDGKFVSSFGQKGSGKGKLNQPSHLCLDSQAVYVTEEKNHRVSVFTRSGHFVMSLGGKGSEPGQFSRPLGVAIDRNRSLYVCDSKNNRIQIFK